MTTFSWVLVFVSLTTGPFDPTASTMGVYNSMDDCFRARDVFVSTYSMKYAQATCISMDGKDT